MKLVMISIKVFGKRFTKFVPASINQETGKTEVDYSWYSKLIAEAGATGCCVELGG